MEKILFAFYDEWKKRKDYLNAQSEVGVYHYWTVVLLCIFHFWILPFLLIDWLPKELMLLLLIPYFLSIIPIANLLLPFVPYVPFKSKKVLIVNVAVILIPAVFIGITGEDFLLKSLFLIVVAFFWFKEEIMTIIKNIFGKGKE